VRWELKRATAKKMDDGYYQWTPRQHMSGGYQLTADALALPVPPSYPPFWFCEHEDGEYHETVEEALACPQYERFMRQMR
jgi:hypothetical protein